MSRSLSRRRLLRGTLGGLPVALALPALEATMGRAALAADSPEPIFGLFFWANGVPWHGGHIGGDTHPDLWTPTGTGPGFTPSPLLALLGDHPYSVVTGLTPHTEIPSSPDGQGDGHMRGFMVATTGDRPRSEGFDHPTHTLTALRPTLDQLIARETSFYDAGVPRYRSLEVGASTSRFHDYGHWNAISYTGPDALNPATCDPSVLYERLFNFDAGTDSLLRRSALLDAVLDDAADLRAQLPAADRARLEAHMEHMYEVQRRLSLGAEACETPAAPGESTDLRTRADLISELLVAALACGQSRVFSYMLSSPASTHIFREVSVTSDMHTVCHSGDWDAVDRITQLQMSCFADLLDRLADARDPTGVSLLDRALVYGVSEYGEGYLHSVSEMPVVLAGRAAGGLQPGVHVREAGGNIARAQLTLLQALGLEFDSFGFNGAETASPFSELLA
jgi:hypothetical protein